MTNNPDLNKSRLTLPNFLTGFRFIASPVLLWLAWHGHGIAFISLLAVTFLTDLLDGLVARLLGQASKFGASLDSWADVITYLTTAIACWWLWPTLVNRELFFISLIIVSCLLPALVGFCKFGCFTSYHTWLVKIAAGAMVLSLYTLFLGGPNWPFRLSAFICILSATEEIAMTFLLTEPESNVRSVFDVLKRTSSKSK